MKFAHLQRKFVVEVNKSTVYLEGGLDSSKMESTIIKVNPEKKEDIHELFRFCKSNAGNIEGILFAWGMLEDGKEFEEQDEIARPFLYTIQEMLHLTQNPPPKIVIISKGNTAVGDICAPSPCGATIAGICKTLIHEHTNLYLKMIDVDPHEEPRCRFQQVEEVFMEIFLDVGTAVTFRDRSRYLPKFQATRIQNKDISLPQGEDRFQLILPSTRSIEDLDFGPLEPFVLKEDEVEIEVKVSALNFKDILNILKPTEEFENSNAVGFDFAGVVKSVGGEVTNVKVGDPVFGVNLNGNGLPSHIRLPAKAVASVPDQFTLAEAACFPAVFSTAYYCLVTIAKMKTGETILIHTASGGVGLCAIQLAQHHHLNIIATAGNQRKRAYLRSIGIKNVFHSRNTSYAKEILKVTGGHGVNIVLNSLTGPGFKEATLEACGENARFVEMSKLNIWTEDEVYSKRPNVEYTIVDLTKLDEATSEQLLKEMDKFVREGVIKPIPYVRFDAVNIRQALQFLQKAKHIGKVVCTIPEVKLENSLFKTYTPMFNTRSTYLITGGLGGIGLEVAKWMSNKGAKNIVLVSRNPPSDNASSIVAQLVTKGMNVVVMHADVGNFQECQNLLQRIQSSHELPPIRGVMHAAGALSDGLIENLTWDKFEDTYKAKVSGSWNLHKLTKHLPLEHFVLYSSITGMFGSPGQANHTSGNCFQDGLALYRYSHGLPATTINWGQWGQVGVAVEYDVPGIRPITTQQALNALENIIKSHRLRTVVHNMESFTVLFKAFPHLRHYIDERAWKSELSSVKKLHIKSEEFWEEYDLIGEDRDGKQEVIKKYIKISLRHILRLDQQDTLDENMELQDMGVDSLMMLEMKNSLQSMFGDRITVTPAALKDCSTVSKLAERLVQIIEGEGEFTSKAPPTFEEINELIRLDSNLPENIYSEHNAIPATLPTQIKCVLVTGATGNLGSYLLAEILRSCPSLEKVYCLIRSKSRLTPKERLNSTLERKCLLVGDAVEKVICIEGNFVEEKLSLSECDYDKLSLEVEGILHCGAKVSHLEYYRKLDSSNKNDIRSVNVVGLLNILAFAGHRRLKHVFNTSTVMTVAKVNPIDSTMLESWPEIDGFDNITNRGYQVSKHVCDLLLKQAVDRGIPCKSFKYPEICGETSSGRFMLESSHYMLLHLFMIKEGIMPSVPYPANLIPVDVAAKLTVEICFHLDSAENDVYLVQNPYPVVSQQFFPDLVRELNIGVEMKLVDFDIFMDTIINQGDNSMLNQFRDLYKDEEQFAFGCATSPQNEAMRKYIENTDDFFVSKRLRQLVPKLYMGIESSYEIMKRDLLYAQRGGYFTKFGIGK